MCAYGVKIYQFKTKNSNIKPYSLCFGNISKGFAVGNIKKNKKYKKKKKGLNGYVRDYSIDYNTIDINGI